MKRQLKEEDDSSADSSKTLLKKIKKDERFINSGLLYFTKVDILPDRFSENAFSLNELLNIIRPTNSIHFNFMIDVSWLLGQYPECSSGTPVTLVVGSSMGTDARFLKQASKHMDNVTVLSAPLPIPYGTHHTKLSIFETDTDIHIIVSTANLVPGDWRSKTQCFYYAMGPLRSSAVTRYGFSDDLIHYLEQYKLESIKYWIDRLQFADLSQVTDRLVYSVPGYHKGSNMQKFGHPSLQQRLSLKTEKAPPPSQPQSRLLIAQCSSIGSLGKDVGAWLGTQFQKAMKAGIASDPGRFLLIFPTVKDVRGSIEGYAMGCSIPYSKSTADKQPWLNRLMCKWRSEKNGRSRAMPHCKTYCELIDGVCQWLLVTSANLSKAAWGELQKNGTQLAIRSYEMGVLITDPARANIPFDYPLAKYSPDDTPWLWDVSYSEPDSVGEVYSGS